MADKDLTVHLKADDKITPVAKKAAKELEKLEKPIELDADVSGVLSALDQVAAEAKATAEAADVLARALGPELAAQADTTRVVGDLRDMGLTLDQIKGNADELAAKMKELSDADVGGKLGGSLGTARGKIDEVSDSARGANSAMANMVGNATQDLGVLGGVAGSAGVAIGQMGEYAADAALGGEKLGSALVSMGKVAGPIAAISLALQAASEVSARFADSSARTKEAVDSIAEAVRSGGSGIDAYSDQIEELGKVLADNVRAQSAFTNVVAELDSHIWTTGLGVSQLARFLGAAKDETTDLTPLLNQAGIELEQWLNLVKGGAAGNERFAATLAKTTLSGDDQEQILLGLTQAQENYTTGTKNAATMVEFFGTKEEDATDSTKDYSKAQEEAARKTGERVEGIKRLAAEQIKARENMEAYNQTVASTDYGTADLAGAATAMSKFTDQWYAADQAQIAFEESSDAVVASIKEQGFTFDTTTDAGVANQKAVMDLARTLDVELADAYAAADGNQETFRQNAQGIADRTLARLQEELGLSAEETQALAVELGLVPENIETRYKLSGDEEAKAKLGLLQGSIDALPKDVQTKVTQQIIMGDYQGALATVNAYYAAHPANLTVKITPQIQAARNLVIPPGATSSAVGATATAAGMSTYAAPATYAAPVYRVPVAVPSITINAGVVGNRFDVDRTVTKALRRHRRLNGERE